MESQNLNVAALYFFENAGRGGASGFLASSEDVNEFLSGAELKTLVGYPVGTVSPSNRGKIHATPFSSASWSQRLDNVYGLPSIPGETGFIGGPLCVQFSNGLFYPAGVFVGCGAEGRVRSFDNELVDLLGRAAVTANGGDDQVSGGITLTNFSVAGGDLVGSVRVIIQPQEAANLAFWNLGPQPADLLFGFSSGFTLSSLRTGTGKLNLSDLPGFIAPPVPEELLVEIRAGQVSEVVFTYEPEVELSPLELFRVEFFGSSNNIGIANDLSDPDGDGFSNEEEFLAGTSPLDNLQIEAPFVSSGQATIRISTGIDSTGNPLAGREGGLYILERFVSPTVSWLNVDQVGPLISDVPPEDGLEVEDASAPVAGALYRVRLEFP